MLVRTVEKAAGPAEAPAHEPPPLASDPPATPDSPSAPPPSALAAPDLAIRATRALWSMLCVRKTLHCIAEPDAPRRHRRGAADPTLAWLDDRARELHAVVARLAPTRVALSPAAASPISPPVETAATVSTPAGDPSPSTPAAAPDFPTLIHAGNPIAAPPDISLQGTTVPSPLPSPASAPSATPIPAVQVHSLAPVPAKHSPYLSLQLPTHPPITSQAYTAPLSISNNPLITPSPLQKEPHPPQSCP